MKAKITLIFIVSILLVAPDAKTFDAISEWVGPSFQVRIDKAGIHFRGINGHRFSMQLVEYGYRGHMQPVPQGSSTMVDGRVTIDHGKLTEWYRSDGFGIEQGFTLTAPPRVSTRGQPLRLQFETGGDLVAVQNSGGRIDLRDHAGTFRMHYGKLHVVDALGRNLPARMFLSNGGLVLSIDDAAATYPVIVDPLFSIMQSLGAGRPGSKYGASIDVSGNNIVVGAPLFPVMDDETGFVRIYQHKENGAWSRPPGGWINGPSGHFGSAVALYGDVLAVGAPLLDSGSASAAGRVFVFRLDPSSYPLSYEGADSKLAVQYAAGGEHLGRALALGDDILVAGSVGAVYVYQCADGGQYSSQRVQKLTPSGGAPDDAFGTAIALDGNTVVVGAPTADGGNVYVFTADVNGTFAQSAVLTAPADSARFGAAVAVADGIILVGAPGAGGTGAAYMYTQDQTGSAPSEAFTAVTADGADFGASVDVDDGRAIVGAPGINKAFIYYGVAAGGDPKLATTYEGLTGKFADGSDERHGLRFGTSVAIDGDVAAVGADESAQKDDDSDSRSGSAYIIEKSIDLSVAVRPDEVSVHKGDNAEFTLTVVNHDPALTAHHVTIAHMVGNGIVESIVPIGDDFVSSSADCDVIPGQVSCDLGTLGPEMSREPSVVVQVVLGSDFQATFGVHAYEADQDENNNEDISDVHSSIKPQESDPPPDSGGGGGALGFFWLLLLAGAWLKRRQP